MLYAVVDIETTGSHAVNSGITEIAVIVSDGQEIIDRFVTLLNPGLRIPSYIEALTGINNNMLKNAPTFSEIAKELYHILEGKIFVAHNVNFDYTFIKQKFSEVGIDYNAKKLCTARLSRQIIPDLTSYGLDKLIRHLNLIVQHRHRAEDDAIAAMEVLHFLLKNDRDQCIEKALKRGSKEAVFPPNFCKEDFEKLPQKPGVYYFLDQKGKVIYVGKAKNLKQRVFSHFCGNSDLKNKQEFFNTVQHVTFEICGNELIALLFESQEIKRLWPPFNQSQKTISKNFGIYMYEDQLGYLRLTPGKMITTNPPVAVFKTLAEAREHLQNLVNEYQLCPKLCGLQKTTHSCYEFQLGRCMGACKNLENCDTYNQRLQHALKEMNYNNGSFVIVGEGRSHSETSLVMIEDGRYRGFGYVEKDMAISGPDQARNFIRPDIDTPDIQRIIQMHLRQPYQTQIIRF